MPPCGLPWVGGVPSEVQGRPTHQAVRLVQVDTCGAPSETSTTLVPLATAATTSLGWPVLLVVGAAPFLRRLIPVYLKPTPTDPPEGFPDDVWPLWYSAFAFVHCRRFGSLFVAGIAAQALPDAVHRPERPGDARADERRRRVGTAVARRDAVAPRAERRAGGGGGLRAARNHLHHPRPYSAPCP